jgi:hypothetical protein
MVNCNTDECKDNAAVIHTSKLGVKSYKKYYCANCYIKLMGWKIPPKEKAYA